ncbi:MAG: GAP family protein [Actinobacteria bacterium]|nr:GAP family protein [Actinomycetota bacterium]MBU4240425.1 GAP family protein [Actinomycetota bacterium]MBU4301326.1 GAP family protein [Actinomycetota bacterium]MBU4489629.1 GAP family protein [Actinomycetota bacterium]MCG2796816.1 GAP family protein [Actinomycetes bacterium]
MAIVVLVSLMLTKNALRSSLFFLLGFTLTLIAIGIVGTLVLHAGGSGGKSHFGGYIDIALGALCFLAIPLTMRKSKERKEAPEADGAKPMTAAKSFSVGVVTMLLNMSTIIIYTSGVYVISSAKLSTADDIIALAFLTVFTLVTLLVPIAMYLVFPRKATKLLASLKVWLARHKTLIGVAILLIFGVLLLIKGIGVVA